MSDQEFPPGAVRVSDDVAHRLLARAIELDERRLTETSLLDLREVAREAGISPEAFEQAVAELRAPRSSAPAPATGVWESIATNTLAFAIFWVILSLVSRILNSTGAPWEIEHLAEAAVVFLGAGIALRLRARFVAFGLAGMGIAQLAKYVMHLMFGIEAVQGGPTQLAVIIAGILGVTLGAVLTNRGALRGGDGRDEPHAQPVKVPDPEPSDDKRTRRLLSLRARTA